MVRWVRWHSYPGTCFEIQTLEVWGRARYLSVTEALHNTEFYEWMGKKHFCFFQTAETGKRTPNSSVKGSGANQYPRGPALDSTGAYMVIFRYSGSCLQTLIYVAHFVDDHSGILILKNLGANYFLNIFFCVFHANYEMTVESQNINFQIRVGNMSYSTLKWPVGHM